jgi:hypothetical protein
MLDCKTFIETTAVANLKLKDLTKSYSPPNIITKYVHDCSDILYILMCWEY